MSELTREAMDQIVNAHFGYEATDDVDGVVGSLTPSVDHLVVGSPLGELHGRDAVRPMYEELFGDVKGESVEPVRRWYGEDFLVDESMWTGHVSDGKFFGLPGRSGHATFRLLHIFELRDGQISRENVWCDTAALLQQLS
jgi:predicted ester cyclase